MIFGLDVASIDGNKDINWRAARAATGAAHAHVRAAFWDPRANKYALDPIFETEWKKMGEAGLTRGAYAIANFRPGATDFVGCASIMLDALHRVGWSITDFVPCLDVEFGKGRKAAKISVEEVVSETVSAVKLVRDRVGVSPMLYDSRRSWREDLDDVVVPDLLDCPQWCAQYALDANQTADFSTAKFRTKAPKPWGDDNFWIDQFQGDARGVPGFSRTVDLNAFRPMIRGEKGPRVEWVQRRINVTRVDGDFGSKTGAALMEFQKLHGLTRDEIVGPRTFAVLSWTHARPIS